MKTRRQIQGEKGCTNSTSLKSVFRPLIASSLALALGVSVASATEPSITYDNGGGDTPITSPSGSAQGSWTWTDTSISDIVGTNDDNFFQLQDSGSDAIKNLTLTFDDITDSNNTPTQNITDNSGVKTLNIKVDGNVSSNDAVLTFSNKNSGKGIILGSDATDANRGTLTFDFLGSDQTSNGNWNFTDGSHTRKMILTLTDTTTYTVGDQTQKVSLVGNILIKAGMGIRNPDDLNQLRPNHQSATNTNVFEATFGGDVIGNITIDPSDIKDPSVLDYEGDPYTPGNQTGYRDITSTFTFNNGASLQGDILANTGNNTFNFTNGGSITGDITADNGTPTLNSSWIAGTDNEYYGAINKITFSENGSIIGDITASNSGQNIITFNSSGTIQGNILSGRNDKFISSSSNHNNFIVFKGSSATITNSSLQIKNGNHPSGAGNAKFSNNILLSSNATEANIQLSSMSASGDYGPTNPANKTFNIIDLGGNNNSLTINSISSGFGVNIIAKGLVSDTQKTGFDTKLNSVYYNDKFFEIDQAYFSPYYKVQGVKLKDSIATELLKPEYSAKGNFVIGSITANSSVGNVAPNSGTNYINVQNLKITGTITAHIGENYIVADDLRTDSDQGIKIVATEKGNNNIKAKSGDITLNGVSTAVWTGYNGGNTIDLGSGSITINARTDDNDANINGKAVYAFNGYNSNSIVAQTIIVNGDITAGGGISGYESYNSITGKTITVTGNISGGGSNKNNFTLNADNATLTLNGKTSGETTHQITSLTATTSGTNTLMLDNTTATSGSIDTTINSVINGQNLAVVMKGKEITNQQGSSEEVALILANGTTLKSVSLAEESTGGHRLAFNAGANSILENINIADAQRFTLDLEGNNTSLNLAGLSGATNINIKGAGAKTLSGGAISAQSLVFDDNNALTIKNTSANFDLANVDSHTVTLTLDGSNNATNTLINKLQGDTLSVKFNGQGVDNGATLKFNNGYSGSATTDSITLKAVSVENDSTNNTLDLSSLGTVGIDSAVNVTSGQGLTFKLANTALTFGAGLTSDGTTTIRVENATTGATLGGRTINVTNLDMVGNGKSKVTFEADTTIGTLNAQASGGNELVIGKVGQNTTLSIGTTNSTLDSVELKGNTAILQLNKGVSLTINTLNTNATTNNLILNDSALSLGGSSNTISNLTTSGNALINLAVEHSGSDVATQSSPTGAKPPRNTLAIENLNGNLSANIFVSKAQADQIKINDVTNADTTLTLYARGSASEIVSTTREDNILVANTSVVSGDKTVNVVGGISDLGGLVVKLNVEEDNTEKGMWYVDKTEVKGVDQSFQEVASTALAVNYNLYLANFNSLNKRMGELRDNPYSNGVWARVFGGNMSSDFGSGNKTDYVTAQAGYDYSLSVGENAKNFIGIALAYGSSWTKANEGIGLTTALLDNINSKLVEVGIYNSYVADSGWYNDTIFKFDYIMSDFDISVSSGGSSSHNTNNFAMVLSDEFGYRYKFAENEKGNWYIDPQVEVAFGYFNQSDFNQSIADNFTSVEASQDAILTLRSRAGLSLGKKFNTDRGFATLYVGAFYEYDYIEGGNAQTQTLGISNTLDKLESNGRAILNVGSNIGLTENARLYIDVEKSFGDKQRTFMQFNLGARYSF